MPSPVRLRRRADLAARLGPRTFQPSSLWASSSMGEIFMRHSLADGTISQLQQRAEHVSYLAVRRSHASHLTVSARQVRSNT
jgi:hypothetical protein